MLVFIANDDADSANLGLHGLSSLLFIMTAMENGEKSKSECPHLESHCWYIHDIYLKVCVSIIICYEDPHVRTEVKNNLFQYVFYIASHWKIVDNVTQTISVAAIIGYDWKQFGILMLLLTSKLLITNSSRFITIKNILNG